MLTPPNAVADLPAGKYKGKYIFTPDTEGALQYPEMDEIWGGTLELPIEFEVKNPNLPATAPAAAGAH